MTRCSGVISQNSLNKLSKNLTTKPEDNSSPLFRHRFLHALLLVFATFVVGVKAQSSSAVVVLGQPVTLTALASGSAPFTYQWYKDGAPLNGATGMTYSIRSYQSRHAGIYSVAISNRLGSATSEEAMLSTAALPIITSQPYSQSVVAGEGVSFAVVVANTYSASYQWRKDGVAIPGATEAVFAIPNVEAGDAGLYTVLVTDGVTVLTSVAATLTVADVPVGFDVAGYLARNADVALLYANDPGGAWMHFWNYGLAEGRTFNALFNVDEYLELNPDLRESFGGDRQAALLHWLEYGSPVEDRMGRVPIGFDVDRYLSRNPDLNAQFGDITPRSRRNVAVWNHYLDYGVREGRNDGDFEAYGYLQANADLAAVYGDDVEAAALHWYFYGRREGRRIPSNFDVRVYRARNPDVVTVWANDLYGCWLHYRDTGVYEGRTYDDLFRVLEYRARYADVRTTYGNNLTGILLHWLYYGKAEGRLGRNP